MKLRPALLAIAIVATLGLSACKREDAATPGASAVPAGETADQFIARVNTEFRKSYSELTSAQWLSSTYINSDTEALAAKANERWLTQLNGWIEQSRRFEGQQMSPGTARAIKLLKLMTAMPAPKDPQKLEELTKLATRMEGMYGAGSYCTGEGDAKTCRDIGQLSEVLATSRDYDAQLDAWQGWHTVSQPMRKDYVRFAELVNTGAKEMGFGKLEATYGSDRGQVAGGMLPAHLMGNLWQQDWGNLWDMMQPYPGAGSLDVNAALRAIAQADLTSERSRPGLAGHAQAAAGLLGEEPVHQAA